MLALLDFLCRSRRRVGPQSRLIDVVVRISISPESWPTSCLQVDNRTCNIRTYVTIRPASLKETRRCEPMTHAEKAPKITCLTKRPASGRTVELSMYQKCI